MSPLKRTPRTPRRSKPVTPRYIVFVEAGTVRAVQVRDLKPVDQQGRVMLDPNTIR